MEELRDIIEELIDTKRESDYWDFKQKHHESKIDLVHDIICMANNSADRDAYIIFGVEDKIFDIVGVEEDSCRRTQQGVIDILKSKKFSSGIRPQIEMRTIYISGHEIDIMIIKNSIDTPYFLFRRFCRRQEASTC
ncbi:ATP-binding protein [Clostridium sp. ZBS12]|uniref:AlbA family DNA-binding domain-containing protein n=1 Tax=Clostridium sp. ZBS12 TaxID=2949972 RepID=UPI00207A2812|nr:ATP-binding protein [Clostridium sp. ZBS12]